MHDVVLMQTKSKLQRERHVLCFVLQCRLTENEAKSTDYGWIKVIKAWNGPLELHDDSTKILCKIQIYKTNFKINLVLK